jgi:hypothetical protein
LKSADYLRNFMKSKSSSRFLDLDRDLPTSAEDILALRLARSETIQDVTTYFAFLASFPPPTRFELAAKKGPSGLKPFEL